MLRRHASVVGTKTGFKFRTDLWQKKRKDNPTVFVRGRVRHPDHKTIVLHGWHQVLMNTVTESMAMRHVAFID